VSTENKSFFNGNNAMVWINGLPILSCHKGKVVKKIKYDELPAATGGGTVRVEVGHTYEVSMSYRPTGIEKAALLLSDDMSIIMTDVNINGTVLKKVKADGITFNEETLIDFEKNKVSEIELSGQAEKVKTLI